MVAERRLYVGPSLRRLRRDHGLTQADMAADLEVSPSYIALLERNHRPLSAEMLLRLSQTYKMDMAALAGDGGSDDVARLQAVLKDPMFGDIDLPTLNDIAQMALSVGSARRYAEVIAERALMRPSRTPLAAAQGIVRGALLGAAMWMLLALILRQVLA